MSSFLVRFSEHYQAARVGGRLGRLVVFRAPWLRNRCDDDVGAEGIVQSSDAGPQRDEAVVRRQTALRAERERPRTLRSRWDPEAKVRLVRYGTIRGTKLESRISVRFRDGAKIH